METSSTFGEWLRRNRTDLRLTREQFASRVGCSVSALRKIEDGERRPSGQIAELIANCLNIPPAERSMFVRVARGEWSIDRLPVRAQPCADPNPTAVLATAHGTLPIVPTPLIGRQHEVTDLAQLLREPQCRMLTLVGPGGIGKTRLAIETAAHMQASFADDAYFVPLASVSTTRLIVPVIADAIGFAFQSAGSADPTTQLFSYLKAKQALLLIDNLEQLLTEPGVEVLAELLVDAPHLKLLVTSREALGLQSEWVYTVAGLPIPDSSCAEQSAQQTSVELFLQRARRAHVAFLATPEDYPAIVRICQLVDGNPLGIELAAAWVRTLSCAEIAREIARGLDFLSVSTRDLPGRHRSMRAVFDHSWKLLSEGERRVLSRLSVFRGGFGREAAERVAEATLTVLFTLVTKSLIHRSSAGQYELHELIRQFMAEQLGAHLDEQAATQARHGTYYLTTFCQADVRLRSAAQHETLAELTVEMDNFRAAWEWAIIHREFALIEQTLRSIWMLYDTRGWFHDGLDALGRAIAALEASPEHAPPERTNLVALGHLLTTRAWFAYRLADYAQAQVMYERSLDILRLVQEPFLLVESLAYLGMLREVTGNYAAASEHYAEGLEIATAIGDRWFATLCRTLLNGLVAITQIGVTSEKAHEQLQFAVTEWRAIGDPRLTGFGLRILSQSALRLGRYDEGRIALEESAALNSAIGFGWGLGAAYRGLGIIAQAHGEHHQAVVMFRKGLETFTELGGNWWVARVLAEMGNSMLALGHEAEAARVWREALCIAIDTGGTPVALDVLAGFASLQMKRGHREQALELLLIVLKHPASFHESKDRAEALRTKLEVQLTSQQVEAAQTRARVKPFDTAVEEILHQASVGHHQ